MSRLPKWPRSQQPKRRSIDIDTRGWKPRFRRQGEPQPLKASVGERMIARQLARLEGERDE